uniref:Calcium voltage-gated channel auxiliary subunit alpha2delta 1 n=1 Tax=Nothobranchius furzeri TaxID=105023 RepID=A0A8C6VS86_NOTFU
MKGTDDVLLCNLVALFPSFSLTHPFCPLFYFHHHIHIIFLPSLSIITSAFCSINPPPFSSSFVFPCSFLSAIFPPTLSQLDANETEGRKYRIRPDFKEDPSYKRLTDHNHTAVHIPTDIYDGSAIVLNELNWTEALEDVFKRNREDDPTLLWQVFGSATGLARYYPASPWMDARKTPSKIDLYDVRRRPWYIQGAASPKDMLILVDASGSVSGLTLKLIRTSVSEMLETLSDDDFVNVVFFNTRVKNTACFDHLVQANVRNKKLLKDAVQNITAKGITNYTKGFEFAFQQLNATNISRAYCNKIIMLFTDGGEERAQFVLEKYNFDKKVRIFTFSVGQHNYDKGPIQWMACSNKGYFYEIPSIGAIRINTQEYLDVLGRPMVLADKKAKQVQWTNVYLDALELGLVITGTLPVFNRTRTFDERNGENQLILGVMAIDVSLDDIKKLTPRFTIGPNGYYFAIDPNGYVLLHPNLQPKNPKFQEPVTLDFLDAELENDVKVEVMFPDKQIVTDRFCAKSHFLFLKAVETLQPEAFDDFGFTYIAPREYCKDLKLSLNNTEFLLDFHQYIDGNTPDACNESLVSRLILDAGLTAELKCQFVSCAVYIFSAGEEWAENPETYESSFYKRTLDNEIYIFTHFLSIYKMVFIGSLMLYFYVLKQILKKMYLFQQVDCVILDDGGFLLMSNREEYISLIGQFFGEVDPVLMISLVNTSLYSFNKTYDYQSVCDPEKDSKAAAGPRSIYVPTIADLLSIGWWASSAAWSMLQQLFVGLLFPNLFKADIPDAMFKESCITEQTQYFFDNDERSYSGTLDCGNYIYFLLKLVKCTPLIADGTVLSVCSAEGPNPCELAQNPRYRKGPDVCFDNNENVTVCFSLVCIFLVYLIFALLLISHNSNVTHLFLSV